MIDEQTCHCGKRIFNEEIAGIDFDERMRLPLFLGYDPDGEPIVIDLSQAPDILISGAPGQGVSTTQRALIDSLLSTQGAGKLKLYLADCRIIDFEGYKKLDRRCFYGKGVSNDVSEVNTHLALIGDEIDHRYEMLRRSGCRNIEEYGEGHDDMPYIVVVINEYSDFCWMNSDDRNKFLYPLIKIAQMGRSVGVHCIISTQKPGVEFITGMIKANFPTRIAVRCSTKVDSFTILDAEGAETLSGKGDSLLSYNAFLTRFQGLFQDERGSGEVIGSINSRFDSVEPISEVEEEQTMPDSRACKLDADDIKAAKLIVEKGTASTSFLQRTFGWGYNKTSHVMDNLEYAGIVSGTAGKREIHVKNLDELENLVHMKLGEP